MKQGARRLKRKKIYRGYTFDIVRDLVRWPNGKLLERDLILHPGISVIVPVLSGSRIVMVRQYRYGADRELWEVPAGTMARGEGPLQCAKREIAEETGYRASKWRRLASVFASPGYISEKLHCFAASGLVLDRPSPEDDEVIRVRVFSSAEVRRMVRTHKIVDAKSLIALFYFWGGRP